MSFSQSVKEEVLKNVKKTKGCCATSFLTAVLKSIGSLCMTDGYCFSVETDNCDLLMFCAQLAQQYFNAECAVYQIKGDSDKTVKYSGKFDLALGKTLNLIDTDDTLQLIEVPTLDLKQECCKRAFMQALFLSCGSVSIPIPTENKTYESKHSNYHLELRFYSDKFAQFVQQQYAEMQFRTITRKNSTVLYLKDSNKIADFLVYLDAVNAKFALEDILIGRSFRNDANRQRNCIDSNIDRAIEAGSKQLAAIKKLREKGLFDSLPQQLQEVAIAREQNPEINLAELAAQLNISKSGVNHRLTKLLEYAQNCD